jgi:murein DD-endopeptidase MepM/ murein hydrolase activator NlpD
MRFLVRWLVRLLIVSIIAAAAAWFVAGRAEGPAVEIRQPGQVVGVEGTLEVAIQAPGGQLSAVEAFIEQGEQRIPLFTLADPAQATLKQEAGDRMTFTRPIGKRSLPALQAGPARLTVRAARPVLYGLRQPETTISRDLRLQFEPPRVSVVSMHHFVNHGGSEMVVYRTTPPDVESGVRVGEVTYRGFPASGAGVAGADPSLKVAFFALLHDQDLQTPIELYGKDAAGNQTRAAFDFRAFPKQFRRSTIAVDDRFFQRVVPDILAHSPELGTVEGAGGPDLLPAFLKVNGELRRLNAEKIASFAEKTAPEILWQGPFQRLSAQVESFFADHRTYMYQGREVDQQVHLGFDLADRVNVPIHAANRGSVLFADYLGIYGNCVILDHGMGVQSLYAHLSSLEVRPGQVVEKGQTLGRSGMTGLAGGDHLHFTMLVNGRPVNSVEWWDPHWIEDRITRKLKEAAAAGT